MEYSEETATKVRQIISGINVNEANLKYIAEHGKINGSLHASLYDIIYKYEVQVSEQSQRITNLIEVKDKLYYRCEELTEQVERQNVLYESRGDAMDELKVENSRLRDERKDYARLLNELIGFIDSGYLVRDISNDHKPDWAMKQFPFLKTLAEIKSLLSKFEAPNQS